MPELPEVEAVRAMIETGLLGRRITSVDDSDPYVCRPHPAGEIGAAIVGRRLTAAHRQGKAMWFDTSGLGRSRTPGPVLGLHLGISGGVVISDGARPETPIEDLGRYARAAREGRLVRFAMAFAGGRTLQLVDPRRLSRVRLDPPLDTVGPDAQHITLPQLRRAILRGTAPVKARLLDQHALSGVGNILADNTLWLAGISPLRSVRDLSEADLRRLARALRASIEAAVGMGGVGGLPVVPARTAGATCPRCGKDMRQTRVAGRATWWCPAEQT